MYTTRLLHIHKLTPTPFPRLRMGLRSECQTKKKDGEPPSRRYSIHAAPGQRPLAPVPSRAPALAEPQHRTRCSALDRPVPAQPAHEHLAAGASIHALVRGEKLLTKPEGAHGGDEPSRARRVRTAPRPRLMRPEPRAGAAGCASRRTRRPSNSSGTLLFRHIYAYIYIHITKYRYIYYIGKYIYIYIYAYIYIYIPISI